MAYYLWRMSDDANWLALDATKYPPDGTTRLYDNHAEAMAEAEKRNIERKNEAQGSLPYGRNNSLSR